MKRKAQDSAVEIQCPHCAEPLDKKWMMQRIGQYNVRLRVNLNGNPKKIYQCGCGYLASAQEIRKHLCQQKPDRYNNVPATKEQKVWYEEHGQGWMTKAEEKAYQKSRQ